MRVLDTVEQQALRKVLGVQFSNKSSVLRLHALTQSQFLLLRTAN